MKNIGTSAFLAAACMAASAFATPQKQAELTVAGYNGLEALENFPVLVRVSETNISGFLYSDCAADGADIAFEDANGNALSREIDTWDTTGESLVWVRLPAMATNTIFKMTWGDSSVTAQPASQTDGSVWQSGGYVGVWHMNEADGTVADAAGHSLAATPIGDTATSIAVSGPIGNGRQTAGSSTKGYLSIPSYDSFSVGATFTMSGWVKMRSVENWPRLFSRKSQYNSDNGWEIEMEQNYTSFAVRGGSSTAQQGTFSTSLQNTWALVTIVYNGTTVSVYQNGRRMKSGTINAATDNGLPLSIGCNSNGSETHIQGAFDECRLLDAVASSEWIAADYATQTSASFLSYGAAEDYSASFTILSKFYAELTVSGYTGGSALANFPVLVRVSPSNIDGFSYADCAEDGSDVTFIDAMGHAFAREIESWNTNGESLVWVRLPTMTTNTTFTMTWGDERITAQPASQTDGSVWRPAGYVGVWHFAGTGTDSAYSMGVTKTYGSPSFTGNPSYPSPVGSSLWVDGASSAGYAAGGPWAVLGSGSSLSLSCWARANTSTPNCGRMISSKASWSQSAGYELTTQNSTTIITVGAADSTQMQTTISTGINTAWLYLAGTYSGTTARFYLNGEQKGSKSDMHALVTPTDQLCLGSAATAVPAASECWNGGIDEVRIRATTSSAKWLAAEYATQASPSFLTYGDAEKTASSSLIRILGNPSEIGTPTPAYGVVDGLSIGDAVTLTMAESAVAGEGTVTNFLSGWTLDAVDLDTEARTHLADSADPGMAANSYTYVHAGYAEFTWLWDVRDVLGAGAPAIATNGITSLAISIPVTGIGYYAPSATMKVVYGLSPEALIYTNDVPGTVTGIGAVGATLTRLAPGMSYYVKAILDNGSERAESPMACLVTDAVSEKTEFTTPGLYAISMTSGSSIDTTTYATATTNIVLSPEMALTTSGWGANTTYAYWGKMYLNGSAYNFAESIDDAVWLKIDGTVVLDNTVWDATTVGSITRPAGWYDFEVRMYNGGGGAGPANKDSWGTETFGFGLNTNGYTGKASSGYTFPADDGSASLFRLPDSAAGMTATEVVSGGALASVELTLQEPAGALDLRVAYGPVHGGENPTGWAATAAVATLASGATSYSWTPPANWGNDNCLVARFYYLDDGRAIWSNSIFWRDYSLPSFANVAADGFGGDTIAVTGAVSSFGGADCALTVYSGTSADALTTAWTGLPGGVLDEAGDFAFTLYEADTNSARRIVPGATYYVAVEAVSGGQLSRSPVVEVQTKAAPAIASCSCALAGRVLTASGTLSDAGARGVAEVRLYVGDSDDESSFTAVGNPVTVNGFGDFSIAYTFPEFDTHYWWQVRATATSTGGETLESRSGVASVETTDNAEYTWKSSVASGNWEDPANWTANKSGDIAGYPASRSSKAKFPENTTATVYMTAEHTINTCNIYKNADVSIVKASQSDGRLKLAFANTIDINHAGGSVALDGIAIDADQGIDLIDGRILVLTNSSIYCRQFYSKGGQIKAVNSKITDFSSGGFSIFYGPDGELAAIFNGGVVVPYDWGELFIGRDAGSYAHVIMTNGAVRMGNNVSVGHNASATGLLEVLDGSILSTTMQYGTIVAGNTSSTASGVIRVRDSIVRNTSGWDVDWLIAGKSGTGEIDVCNSLVSNQYGKVAIALNAGSTGTLAISNGTEVAVRAIHGGSGTSTLVMDGAVAIPKVSGDFMYGIGAAKIGAGGLTILTDYATTISQSFENLGAADGLLVLAGPGAKTLTGAASAHSVTRLVEGATALPATHGATVEVKGGTLNLADGAANAVTYGGLVVGTAGGSSGILAMDAGDTITTTQAPVFNGVYLALNGTPANGTYPLVQTAAAVSSAAEAGWQSAYIYSGRQEGKMYLFTVTESGGVTSFNLVVADAGSLGASTVWTASGQSGAFSTDANWEGGAAPGVLDIATFSREDAAPEVVVSGANTVGAIAFSAERDYTLTGSGPIAIADSGVGYVSAAGGDHKIATDMTLSSVMGFSVGAGSSLEVSGDISNGAVTKTGDGTLVLSGDGNSFMERMMVNGGTLSLASAAADGFFADSANNDLIISNGTFRFDSASDDETLGRRLVASAGSSRAAVADIKSPLTVTSFVIRSGSFIKRGPGKLTFDLSQNTTVSREAGVIRHAESGSAFAFPDSGGMNYGSANNYFAGLSVAEGVVEFTGDPSVTLNGGSGTYIDIGLNTTTGTADTELILNGIKWGDNANFQMGAVSRDAFARNFTYRVVNGGRHSGNSVYMWGTDNGPDNSSNFHIDVEDNSFLAVSYSFRLPEKQYSTVTLDVLNNSALCGPDFGFASPFSVRVVDSQISKASGNFSDAVPGTEAAGMSFGYYAKGVINLENAEFRIRGMNRNTLPNYNTVYSTNAIVFNFDDVRWFTGSSDVTLRLREAETFTFNVEDGGLVISNNAGRTFTTAKAFTGTGAITKAGAGDLVFEPAISVKGNQVPSQSWALTTNALERTYTLDVTGGLNVLGGTVYVTADSMRPGLDVHVAAGATLDLGGDTIEVASLSGAGTIRNGTLVVGLVRVDVDEGAITLDNATIAPSRKVVIDFGRTSANPLALKTVSYPVFRFTATAPDYSRWRVANTGIAESIHGVFAEDGDTVVVTLKRIGQTIIILQ